VETLLAFEDCHLRQSFTIIVLYLLSFSLLVLIEVQTGLTIWSYFCRLFFSMML
jgi:hypothetical protein